MPPFSNKKKCHRILANLRKDKSGRIITDRHYVPSGGLFEFVACPHYSIEIVIYLIITMIQGFRNYYWNLIFLLVLSTQMINGLNELKWYRRSYKDYPKEKKSVIPKIL